MRKIIYGEHKNLIHKRVKLYRMMKGLTQEQLAAKMQTLNVTIEQQMISKIEHNSRLVTDYELVSFSSVLGVERKDLLQDFYHEKENP